jgi:hypothetical protein
MNAGAEYVLYRIWATLQEREGIHAESLITCLGALAGYACQAHVRQAGVPAASSHFITDALNRPLIASPLSVWSLVRRAVQKTGGALPDIESICAHVTRTLETPEFGVPRVPHEHRPRRLPLVYLTQLWPQVLPIAKRFCRRPAQLPVLFGIALQRAIEHTTERLSPTLAASIAMECAVAMSKVTLPTAVSDLFQPSPAAPDITVTAKPFNPPPLSEIRARRKKRGPIAAPGAFEMGAFTARMRSAKGIATIMSLAIIAVVGFSWKTERPEAAPMSARAERSFSNLKVPAFQVRENTVEQPLAEPQVASQIADQPSPVQDAPFPEAIPQPAEELALPAPVPDTSEGIIAPDGQSA